MNPSNDPNLAKPASPNEFVVSLEQGKKFAGRRKYAQALGSFQSALRMGANLGVQHIMMRHVSECAIDCLELMEEYSSAQEYFDEIIRQYGEKPPESLFAFKDLANTHLRKAILCMKQDDAEGAKKHISDCLTILNQNDIAIPFAAKVENWLNHKRFVTQQRLVEEQKRQGVFSVFVQTKSDS